MEEVLRNTPVQEVAQRRYRSGHGKKPGSELYRSLQVRPPRRARATLPALHLQKPRDFQHHLYPSLKILRSITSFSRAQAQTGGQLEICRTVQEIQEGCGVVGGGWNGYPM